ncbi:hypothetical protein ARNL5_03623 [Anaerolineae bacterium]|nr:hypothetical protein ARNL5_03623 [Anaerolineae bacterium]
MRIRISSWKPVIFIGVIASLCGGISTIAYCRNALYKEVSNWQIGDSNPPARLLWQHVEQRVPAYQSSSPPNALVASDAHLAYMRFAYFLRVMSGIRLLLMTSRMELKLGSTPYLTLSSAI